jgi:neutral amino acid transport system permease protein
LLRRALHVALGTGIVLGALLALSGAALAQEEDEETGPAVRGTLRFEGEPVEGAVISVFDGDGNELGQAESDAEGGWRLGLPGPGEYSATLQEDSLPEGVGLRDPDRGTLEFSLRTAQERTLLFPLGEREGAGARWIPRVLQSATNGLKFGLIIAMTAIGLSLIFGTTGLVNFAHGELVTFGAVVAWFMNIRFGSGSLVWVAVIAVALGALVGAGMEKGIWKPLRARGTGLIQMMVISIGLMLVVRHLIQIVYGGRSRPFLDFAVQRAISLGPIRITPRDMIVMILSLMALVAVATMLQKTKIGKAMRAVSDNRDLAESSGIDVQRVILFVWVLGAGLAAMGGVFLGVVENVSYLMGFRLLLLIFAAVILGGLGTAYGALVGAIAIGLVTEMSTLYFSAELKFVWALFIMALVLLVRPQGLLGHAERIG